jgi:hypothetical protein
VRLKVSVGIGVGVRVLFSTCDNLVHLCSLDKVLEAPAQVVKHLVVLVVIRFLPGRLLQVSIGLHLERLDAVLESFGELRDEVTQSAWRYPGQYAVLVTSFA